MTLVHLNDNEGYTYRLTDINLEYNIPCFSRAKEAAIDFNEIEARHDDILLCGYPKAGCHWLWEVLGMLSRGSAEYVKDIKESLMMERTGREILAEQPSPRILNSHHKLVHIPEDFRRKRCKIIYAIRNPKDSAVSHYNHVYNMNKVYQYDGSWKSYLQFFLDGKVEYGNWFEYVTTWEKDIANNPELPVLVVHYEKLKQNPVSVITEIARFLQKSHDAQLCQEIADKCSFSNMRIEKPKYDDKDEIFVWRNENPQQYRKGIVGDWKNWFTVAQNEAFDQIYKERMKDSRLQISFQ